MEQLEAYIGWVPEIIKRVDAREETFYPVIETLLIHPGVFRADYF